MSGGINAAFQKRFREAFDNANISMRRLSVLSGYGDSYLCRLFHGQQSNPTIQVVEVLALTLGVSVAWLLGLEGTTDETLHSGERNVLAS